MYSTIIASDCSTGNIFGATRQPVYKSVDRTELRRLSTQAIGKGCDERRRCCLGGDQSGAIFVASFSQTRSVIRSGLFFEEVTEERQKAAQTLDSLGLAVGALERSSLASRTEQERVSQASQSTARVSRRGRSRISSSISTPKSRLTSCGSSGARSRSLKDEIRTSRNRKSGRSSWPTR